MKTPTIANIQNVLERHKANLLSLPGCTAVAISRKVTAGETLDIFCIVVFVEKKCATAAPNAVPEQLDGVSTDVVERTFAFEDISTDPFARFNPLISGISVTAYEDSQPYGTIGCFIQADGTIAGVPAGVYMLTNQHVLQAAGAPGSDPRVIQPGNVPSPPPANNVMGNFQLGRRDTSHDCALSTLQGRGYSNVVPNHPWHPGNRTLAGIAAAAVGDHVYKYGATTRHTVGNVTSINFNTTNINNAIYIAGENNGLWTAGGDSGSVMIRYSDDFVLGLNFKADTNVPVPGGYSGGLAYDITTQIQVFSTNVQLA